MSRIAVRVTPDGARHVRAGHPWLFDGSIESVSREGTPGEVAVVFDQKRKFAGIGLWDPDSPIRVKLLHHGSPTTIDEAFFEDALTRSIERRRPLLDAPDTTGYRLVHGENDGLPGLIVDRYSNVMVVKIYTRAWLPHLDVVVSLLQSILPAKTVLLRYSRAAQPEDGPATTALVGTLPTVPILFSENGLTFEADVVKGQKTGFFLDQRENRAEVRARAKGATVLDVFSCSGGFSVAAAAGGATSVISTDLSAAALATAERNFHHNRGISSVARCKHETIQGDAFQVLERLGREHRRFDIVVIDPPSFAMRKEAVPGALRSYARLTVLGLHVLERGGLLVQSSCSSRVTADAFYDAIDEAARNSAFELQPIERTQHTIDHPIGFGEGAYLKTQFARRPRL